MSDADVAVIGAGVAGLASAYTLAKAGKSVVVVEKDDVVGGLSKTVVHNGFRFDLGGHRFFTKNEEIEELVRGLLKDELAPTPRSSKIFMRGKYFDYPLRPMNALFGLGVGESAKIILDYLKQKVTPQREIVSLEDWVVANFGRELFKIFFKEYSEKVWGIPCNEVSAEWVAQRIRGLSLSVALRDALVKLNHKEPPTLIKRFLYPKKGIGRLSERFVEEIQPNPVHLGWRVHRVEHGDGRVRRLVAERDGKEMVIEADNFISSAPLPLLVKMLSPEAPEEVIRAADSLEFRATVIVAVMVNRPRVTNLSWIYIPEKKIPFGRIHEPNNWSPEMSPPGKSSLVVEYFCFEGEKYWNMEDAELAQVTAQYLEELGFIRQDEVIDHCVVRVARAYPLLRIGYREHYNKIIEYLKGFKNLQVVGRTGMFRYHNIDHAIETGVKAAKNLLGEKHDVFAVNVASKYLEEKN